ncbi:MULTISPECIES: universal stress protein [Gemella]|uniref:universal stress protein n=1 Tax=Gemella TaxID=1378 RepID=UPI0007683A0F|nr:MULTISPECIES: universal stress protein [Gemella]AME09869.1 universal stress protein [Gemella sp. oral taxon 928]AXI26007.1 universal stress protein [Gemella sp. ND 6198]
MENNYSNILVAVDGSYLAEWAFENAVSIAKKNNGSHLFIVSVVDKTISSTNSLGNNYTAKHLEFAEKLVNGYATAAKKHRIAATGIAVVGIPKIVITEDILEKYNIDLVVCGSSGLTGLKRVLIGSVSEGIVRYANCDVIVIKHYSIPENYTAKIISELSDK